MKITLISDTHNKHEQITQDLVGGDLIIHAGDISSMGYECEVNDFLEWFQKLPYNNKVFISGNHDWLFMNYPKKAKKFISCCEEKVRYLQDKSYKCVVGKEKAKIYGSPWQPEFYNWAFNLQRRGEELRLKWEEIPLDTDILITHGPSWGVVDEVVGREGDHLGCELLAERIKVVKPKIHVCGHIHSGHGYHFDGTTHFFNASILNERYVYGYKPFSFDWNSKTNEIIFN